MKFASSLVLSFLCALTALAQLPVSPNARDENNLRTGHWTMLYDSAWHEVHDPDSATYYRLITFEHGKPKGKVRDFYKSGQKQWDGYLIEIEPEVFDGESRAYYQNGRLKTQSFYKDKVLNGPYREYTNKGVLIVDGFYENNQLTGKYTSYHENGNMYYQADMKDGLLHGDMVTYFDDGAEQGRGRMEKGNKVGLWEFRRRNGKLESKAFYKDQNLNGLYEAYDENGVLVEKGLTKDGYRDGWWTTYYPNGSVKEEGAYISATGKTGVWKEYYENGALKSEGPMKDGLRDGEFKYYHPNKQLLSIGKYVSDSKKGMWSFYYDNGNLQTYGAYYDSDSLEGKWIFYYPNGNVTCEGLYVKSKREGQWKYYDEDGNTTLHDHRNDLAHGIAVKYFTDGTIKEQFYYEDGDLQGLYTTYYHGGQLESKLNYDHGSYDGEYETYYSDGQPHLKTAYKQGKLHGPYVEYHRHGKVYQQGTYNMGRKIIMWEEYWDNGQLGVRKKYKKDTYTWIEFYESGKKKSEGEGVVKGEEDLQNGYQVKYFENGFLNSKGVNINGLPQGKFIYYDSLTGKKYTEGPYKDGRYHGLWQWYDEKGRIISKSYFVDGFRETAENIRDSIYTCLGIQDYDLALKHIEWYKKVLARDIAKTDPLWNLHYRWLGEIYLNRDEYDKALANYGAFRDETSRLESDSAYNYVLALNGIANTYSKMEKYEESYKINSILVSKATPDFNDHVIYLYNRSINLYNMKRVAEAVDNLKTEVKRRFDKFGRESKEHIFALNLLATFEYYYEENYDQALADFNILLDLLDVNDDRYLEALREISNIYNAQHKYDESIEWLTKAIDLQAERKVDYYYSYYDDVNRLAYRYGSKNNYQQALTILTDGLKSLEKHNKIRSYECAKLLYEVSSIVSREMFDYKNAFFYADEARKILEEINRVHVDLYGNIMYMLGMCSNQDPITAPSAEYYYRTTVEFNRRKYGDKSSYYLSELISLAGYFTGSYKFAKADSTLKVAEKTVLDVFGTSHYLYASVNKGLGDMHILQYKYHDAIDAYTKYTDYYAAIKDTYPKHYAAGLRDLAYVYDIWSNYEKAEEYINSGLKVYEDYGMISLPAYHDAQVTLAENMKKRFLFQESIAMYKTAIAGYKTGLGEDNKKYRAAIFDLAKLYISIKEYKLADETLRMAADLSIKHGGTPVEEIYYQILEEMAVIKTAQRNFTDAEYYYRAAREAGKPYEHTALFFFFLQRYGNYCFSQSQYSLAEQLLNEAVQRAKNLVGENHWFFATIAIDLSKVYRNMGKLANAERMIQKALVSAESNKEEDPGAYITAVRTLAQNFRSMGRYEEAEELHNTILEYVDNTEGKSNWYGVELLDAGQLYLDWGRYDLVKKYNEDALLIFEETLAPDHENILIAQNQLGLVALWNNDLETAHKHFTYCKEKREVSGKTKVDQHANTLHNLATVDTRMNKFAEAEEKFQKSVSIRKENKIEANLLTEANLLDDIAVLYQRWGKHDLAEAYWRQTLDKLITYIRTNFPFMSDYEKAKFWERNKKDFEYFNTFAIDRQKKNPLVLAEMFNYRLATKGILLSASNKLRKRIYASRDSLLIGQYHHWTELREQIAKEYSHASSNQKTPRIDSLEQLINVIEKDLSLSAEEGREDRDRMITWKEVQRSLASDEAAIEFVRYRHFNHELTDSVIYAALILTAETKTSPKVVVFPDGKFLEGKAYRYYRNNIVMEGDDDLSYKSYWAPIEAHLNNKTTVYLSLDGVFNQINMKTLRGNDGKFLMEKKDFVVVSNTRDLVAMKARRKLKLFESASLIGNPKFFLGGSGQSGAAGIRAADDLDRSAIAELPGTGVEVETIENLLTAKGWKVNALVETRATEAKIKQLPSSRVLHFATHGFFKEVDNNNVSWSNADPMLRSGILLTGAANYIQHKIESDNGENGILTAFEAANLSLEGTELVVLSACETAKGEIQQGEGVYGLQRAFITAGAESLIMSLWKVDDEATKRLMSVFYENWMNGMEKSEALNEAQRTIRKIYPHPYYWGAFVMIKG